MLILCNPDPGADAASCKKAGAECDPVGRARITSYAAQNCAGRVSSRRRRFGLWHKNEEKPTTALHNNWIKLNRIPPLWSPMYNSTVSASLTLAGAAILASNARLYSSIFYIRLFVLHQDGITFCYSYFFISLYFCVIAPVPIYHCANPTLRVQDNTKAFWGQMKSMCNFKIQSKLQYAQISVDAQMQMCSQVFVDRLFRLL